MNLFLEIIPGVKFYRPFLGKHEQTIAEHGRENPPSFSRLEGLGVKMQRFIKPKSSVVMRLRSNTVNSLKEVPLNALKMPLEFP